MIETPDHYNTKIYDPAIHRDWWSYVRTHPLNAMEDPLWPLMQFAEPDLWLKTEEECLHGWMVIYSNRLNEKQLRRFGADCIERKLDWFRGDIPLSLLDLVPVLVEAIHIARTYQDAEETYSIGQKDHVHPIRVRLDRLLKQESIWCWRPHLAEIVEAIKNICMPAFVLSSQPTSAAGRVSYAVKVQHGPQAQLDEDRWQWSQLQRYFKGEIS